MILKMSAPLRTCRHQILFVQRYSTLIAVVMHFYDHGHNHCCMYPNSTYFNCVKTVEVSISLRKFSTIKNEICIQMHYTMLLQIVLDVETVTLGEEKRKPVLCARPTRFFPIWEIFFFICQNFVKSAIFLPKF